MAPLAVVQSACSMGGMLKAARAAPCLIDMDRLLAQSRGLLFDEALDIKCKMFT